MSNVRLPLMIAITIMAVTAMTIGTLAAFTGSPTGGTDDNTLQSGSVDLVLLGDREWKTCSAGPIEASTTPIRAPDPLSPGGVPCTDPPAGFPFDDEILDDGFDPEQPGKILKTILNGSSTPIFPGDYGEITWSFRNATSSVTSSPLSVIFDDLKDIELGCSALEGPPPSGPDPTCGAAFPPGELSSEIIVHIWHDTDCDNFFDEAVDFSLGVGTDADFDQISDPGSPTLAAAIGGGLVLVIGVLAPGAKDCVAMTWWYVNAGAPPVPFPAPFFPGSNNNASQSDETSWDVTGELGP